MIALRISKGVAMHFLARITEWIGLCGLVTMSYALHHQPDMFQTSPSFRTIAAWADEGVWMRIIAFFAALRGVALIVNGSFKGFPFSPHLRASASFVAMMFWCSYFYGFLHGYLNGGAASALSAYSTIMLVEITNLYLSCRDIGEQRAPRGFME